MPGHVDNVKLNKAFHDWLLYLNLSDNAWAECFF